MNHASDKERAELIKAQQELLDVLAERKKAEELAARLRKHQARNQFAERLIAALVESVR